MTPPLYRKLSERSRRTRRWLKLAATWFHGKAGRRFVQRISHEKRGETCCLLANCAADTDCAGGEKQLPVPLVFPRSNEAISYNSRQRNPRRRRMVSRRNQVIDLTSHSEVLMHRLIGTTLLFLAVVRQAAADETRPIVLKPARVFDGINRKAHDSWVLVIRGEKIDSVGPAVEVKIPKG